MAGIANMKFIHETSLEEIQSVINVNLMGSVYMMNKVIPIMIKQTKGHIINISSACEFIPGIKM